MLSICSMVGHGQDPPESRDVVDVAASPVQNYNSAMAVFDRTKLDATFKIKQVNSVCIKMILKLFCSNVLV